MNAKQFKVEPKVLLASNGIKLRFVIKTYINYVFLINEWNFEISRFYQIMYIS